MTSKIDWSGNVTTSVHDAWELGILRTEGSRTPSAHIIITEWHSDLSVPVGIIKSDSVAEYMYDGSDR